MIDNSKIYSEVEKSSNRKSRSISLPLLAGNELVDRGIENGRNKTG